MAVKRIPQPCPICDTPEQLAGEYDICEVCGWEENPYDEDANDGFSITEARNKWNTGQSINEYFPYPNGIS